MTRSYSGRPRQAGMSLIEVLIAMALSSFVLISVGYAYLTQRSLERHRGAVASVQDSARAAFEPLGRDLRQVGYVGCNSNLVRANQQTGPDVSILEPFPVAAGGVDNFTIDSGNAVRAFDGKSTNVADWGGSVPANLPTDPAMTPHAIEIRYGAAEGSSSLSQAIRADGKQIFTRSPIDLGRGDDTPSSNDMYALMSDCASGLIVVVDSVANAPASVSTDTYPVDWTRCAHASRVRGTCFYWPSTTLMPIRVVQYYVANTGTTASPTYGLFMRKRLMKRGPIVWNTPIQLIDNVNNFRVSSVGLDTNDPNETYWAAVREVGDATSTTAVAALPVDEWRRTTRVDIRLSLRAPGSYGADGKPIVRTFESSFAIRARSASEVL